MERVEQRLTAAEIRLNDHHTRLLELEGDRTMVRELVAQTRALAEQAARSFTQLDDVAERAVEKVLHRRRQDEETERLAVRERRRDGWRYRLLWGGFLATAAYASETLLAHLL